MAARANKPWGQWAKGPQLANAIETHTSLSSAAGPLRMAKIIQVPYQVVERLSEYPERDLDDVLDCLELLLDGAKTLPLAQAYASGWVDKAKPILAAGVEIKDKRMCEAAVNLVNRFIASGHENQGLEDLLTGSPCAG